MDNYEGVLRLLLEAVQANIASQGATPDEGAIPVGISNRHVHLSQADLELLFGKGYEMVKMKDLSQPGQFACQETITLCGPKGAIEKVRILGPVRSRTQIEILEGDCFKLGVKAKAKMSGDLDGTPGITLVGPKGSVQTKDGLIIAQRHIHMTPEDANRLGVADGDVVAIEVTGDKGGIYKNVAIRATSTSALECHLDNEEANAMGVNSKTTVCIVK